MKTMKDAANGLGNDQLKEINQCAFFAMEHGKYGDILP